MVAAGAGGDHVSRAILAATGLGADVVDSQFGQAIVVDRRLATVSAAVIPSIFDGIPPLLTGLTPCQSSHVEKVVGDPFVQGKVGPVISHPNYQLVTTEERRLL